jgi:DNA ligase-1
MKTLKPKFSPMLAPNETVNLHEIKYPLLASKKLDGIRCIFYYGKILSRSLKPIQNKQLREKFEPILKLSEQRNVILDGEIFSPELSFQTITSMVMTRDFADKRSIKKFGKTVEIPESLQFYCFDVLDEFNCSQPFALRCMLLNALLKSCTIKSLQVVNQCFVENAGEVETLFAKVLSEGYEGLILRDPEGRYKCGRGTLKEGLIYKVKPFETFDAQIIDVIQGTVVDENAERKVNELGRSVTSKKKEDRVLVEKASAFVVMHNERPLKVILSMTDEEKEDAWINRKKYIGRYIEYKAMEVGMKDLPRHPTMLRFRNDKD